VVDAVGVMGDCHQVSISPTFFEQLLGRYSYDKKLQTNTESREKLLKALLYEKTASILCASFFYLRSVFHIFSLITVWFCNYLS